MKNETISTTGVAISAPFVQKGILFCPQRQCQWQLLLVTRYLMRSGPFSNNNSEQFRAWIDILSLVKLHTACDSEAPRTATGMYMFWSNFYIHTDTAACRELIFTHCLLPLYGFCLFSAFLFCHHDSVKLTLKELQNIKWTIVTLRE